MYSLLNFYDPMENRFIVIFSSLFRFHIISI
nr:MAG TPA: hypothetical protein [Bacteriophage sp.]